MGTDHSVNKSSDDETRESGIGKSEAQALSGTHRTNRIGWPEVCAIMVAGCVTLAVVVYYFATRDWIEFWFGNSWQAAKGTKVDITPIFIAGGSVYIFQRLRKWVKAELM